jgi:imidazoleglycerol phosphate synthase glutamine amidotransferase subunit HisH
VGSGRVVAVQVEPERVSTTGTLVLLSSPTATQSVAEAHETPQRLTCVEPVGSGRVVAVQVEPERVSTTGTVVLLSSPTATQSVAEMHETASR